MTYHEAVNLLLPLEDCPHCGHFQFDELFGEGSTLSFKCEKCGWRSESLSFDPTTYESVEDEDDSDD